MAKIVKAGFSRVVDPPPKPRDNEEPDAAPVETPIEPAVMPDDMPDFDSVVVTKPLSKEDYQAAYDELIIAAQDEVAALLSDARNEALSILRDAEQKAAELRDMAWDEGDSAVYAHAKAEVDEIVAQANRDAEAHKTRLASEREESLKSLERQMLGVALDVAGKILHKELDDDEQAYLSMLREAVSRMPAEDSVVIRLNPVEYERFFNEKETKMQTSKGQVDAKLIPDPSLERYDAVIESPSGVIDAGADTQLDQMKRNFGIV